MHFSQLSNPPAGEGSSGIPLQNKGGPSELLVLLPLEPASHPTLDQNPRRMQFIPSQLLQHRNLAGSEEDLGLAEAVLLGVRDEVKKRFLARAAHVIRGTRPTQ